MDESLQLIIIDALTEAIKKNTAVTIKNNINNCIIVITATEDEIIVSVSKIPYMVNDMVTIISDALGVKPDMVYDRISILKDDFLIYYMIWLRNFEQGKDFIEKEYAIPQNHITYLSQRVINHIENIN